MKSFLLTGDYDTLIGMRLAGIQGSLVLKKEIFLKLLHEKVEDPEIGIIMVSSPTVDLGRSEFMDLKLFNESKLLIEIPTNSSSYDNDYITKYIKESIGIKF